MKKYLLFLFFVYSSSFIALYAQTRKIDSLRHILKVQKEDTSKARILLEIGDRLCNSGKYDSSLVYANMSVVLAEKLNFKRGVANAFTEMGLLYTYKGDYNMALKYHFNSLSINQETGNKSGMGYNFNNIGLAYWYQGKYTQALEYYNKAITTDLEIGNKSGNALSLGNIGLVYSDEGAYDKALEYNLKALKINREIGNKSNIADNLNNIGLVYRFQGNYPKALEFYLDALKLHEELGDKSGSALNLGNIGVVYHSQGNEVKAQEYYFKALAIDTVIGDKNGIARNMGNIGVVYDAEQEYDKALEYDFKALAIDEEIKDKGNMGNNYGNIGLIYEKQGNLSMGIQYSFKALAINRELSNKEGMAFSYLELGDIYNKQKRYKQAKLYLDSSLALSYSIGEKEIMSNVYLDFTELDSATANYKAGLVDYKNYIVYRDSLINEANTKKTVQEQMNYDFEQKQAAAKAEQDKKDAIAGQEQKKQLVIRNSFIAGFTLMLALAFFIFRGYRQKQKANKIITRQKEEVEKQKALVEQQKSLVEEKNKDILDSIMYAKRLQDAILPPLNVIKQFLPESFVLYKPKDIVAGDFYWLERAGDTILVAAADCTGHGVPGALVSVVCSNALNRTVKEFKITEPGKILDKVRELVLETFEKSEDNVQDGMDISLCAITFPSPKREGVTDVIIAPSAHNTITGASLPLGRERVRVDWAGANNSLWYVENNEMKEIAPDKQPIGKTDNPKLFNTHILKLQKGDTLYLFTDGYADQFGGEKGKKFKYKQMQEKLLAISHKPLAEQKQELETIFHQWKGSLEQVDDVLVMGIKI